MLLGGEKARAGAVRTDPDSHLSQTAGAMALVSGTGTITIDSLIGVTAFKKDTDIPAAAGPMGANLGLGNIILIGGAFNTPAGNFENVIRFFGHGLSLVHIRTPLDLCRWGNHSD